MPTVLRIGHLRVVIYPNDHRPPHVHVFGYGGEALFNLNCPAGPLELREQYRLKQSEVQRIATALREHIPQLCAKWEEMHGHY